MDPRAAMGTAMADELDRFDRLAATWWDPMGPMRPLHVVNALRKRYLLDRIASHLDRGVDSLEGLRVLDVGCGAGLLSEPLAKLGAGVVGVDASRGNVEAARGHAASQGLQLDYRLGEPQQVVHASETFDVVLALEVVEHVRDVAAFVGTVARHVAPGGLLLASTIDRTFKSFLFAIVGAEYVLRLLPRGTHHWRRFVRPAELSAAAVAAGLHTVDLRGMRYAPLRHHASWCSDTRINYMATYARPAR